MGPDNSKTCSLTLRGAAGGPARTRWVNLTSIKDNSSHPLQPTVIKRFIYLSICLVICVYLFFSRDAMTGKFLL
uniref:Uncharacterized protein n=1 Tax=Oryzias latipes TaxID=8090 RepID=A0A3P9KHE1_ORYLA